MTNIILLTRDRPRLLRQCLDSLFGSAAGRKLPRHHPHPFTLTVIDDGTTDNAAQRILSDLPRNCCRLEVFRNSGHNIGELKSAGVVSADLYFGRGEWLCIADNDVYWQP
jgi:glycosyltransferase involved in cell wall biosynthesis